MTAVGICKPNGLVDVVMDKEFGESGDGDDDKDDCRCAFIVDCCYCSSETWRGVGEVVLKKAKEAAGQSTEREGAALGD